MNIEEQLWGASLLPCDEAGRAAYRTYLKPYVAKLLTAIGLDVTYHRGAGDWLYYLDDAGCERRVLDMIGGFGASLFGHNHPELVARAQAVLTHQRPMLVQASARSYAGLLAQRLAEMVAASTGHLYIVTLTNSGAETVEAALKHAELTRQERIQSFIDGQQRMLRKIRLGISTGAVTLPDKLFDQAAALLDVADIPDLDVLHFCLTEHNLEQLQEDTSYLAIVGSFHGKSSGAVKLTHSPDFRKPWHHLGIQVNFLPRNQVDAVWSAVTAATVICYELAIGDDGVVQINPTTWSRIVGCFAEPIQGEGGIHELTSAFLGALRTAADQAHFPLILDEIQSGMGRSGTLLAAEASGVAGDYILLGKALGGGLAKQGALLVRADQYIEEFGYLHTSTFAEDDFSAAIGLAALDLVTRDQGALLQGCREKGDYLLQRLRALQACYPQVIREVRGRGLMIGVELIPQHDSASNLLRVVSEQNLLGFLTCGYLLHEEGIRIAPTLAANSTIRLVPSAFIQERELAHFCAAFERAVAAIARANAHTLTRHIAGWQAGDEAVPQQFDFCEKPNFSPSPRKPTTRRVACIAHFIEPADLLHWDPMLAPLSSAACSQLLDKTHVVLDPFLADQARIDGPWGEQVEVGVVGLPFTAAQIMAHIRRGDGATVREQIEAAVDLAKGWGATLIGFAGYTSIVTNNCQLLVEDSVGLTSGNSLTAAAALAALRRSACAASIDLATARLGIVGGAGNIGRVLAECMVNEVPQLTLIGRPGAERRLQRLADELKRQGATVMPQVSTDLADLQSCNLIISATNAPEPILCADHLGAHPTVLCDVAVPGDATPDLATCRPHVQVIKGGIMHLPHQQELTIRGMALAQGEAYACLAEVILLGLAGIREHFSYGPLRAERVQQIGALAEQYGFGVKVRTL
ncbi:MAG: aminotransferase class III-fold pyridoxal phosphate-dependent enzyme [Caldilineaceae bacterium]